MPMGTKPGRVVTYNEEQGHVVLQGHMINEICYIPTTTMNMATKHGRVVTYYEVLPFIKSQDPLIRWSCKATQQIKYFIFLLPQSL